MFLLFSLSIGVISLASGAVISVSQSQLHSPLVRHHLHHRLVHEKLRNGNGNDISRHDARQGRRRAFGFAPDDCPGTPYLWKITEDATGKHVGFGLGTMHLPIDVVTTTDGYNSILAAIDDSCDVYGEIKVMDDDVAAELAECGASIIENSATVEDIPDGEFKDTIKAKIFEIATMIEPTLAGQYAAAILTLPISEVQNLILYANTPEYRDKYLSKYVSIDGVVPLDTHLVALGRPGDGLEEVATQCDLLSAVNPSAEDLNQALEQNPQLMDSLIDLNATLSPGIQMYICGDIDAFIGYVTIGISGDAFMNDIVLANRNKQMAEKMNDILEANPDERIFFAVGFAHWNIGSHSLELLLKDYGYTLEHVPEWDTDRAEDHTNDHCRVIQDPETGLFDDVPEGSYVPGAAPIGNTMAPPHHGAVLPGPVSESPSANEANDTILQPIDETNSPTTKQLTGTLNPAKKNTNIPTLAPLTDETLNPTKEPTIQFTAPLRVDNTGIPTKDPIQGVSGNEGSAFMNEVNSDSALQLNETISPTTRPITGEAFSPTTGPNKVAIDIEISLPDAQSSSSAMLGSSKIVLMGGFFYLWCFSHMPLA